MANYFQDPSQSFVPTPVYRPPFEAIQSTLMAKQQKYDAGLSNVRSVYNSIFNAPLTNGENSQVRAQFLTDAENKLKNLSQVDLSIESNQNEARNVFAPFYKDQSIVTDMVYTKQQGAEVNNFNSFKPDKDSTEYADQRNLANIQTGIEKVKNADRGDLSVYNVRKFVPYHDISKEVVKMAKDAGFVVENYIDNGTTVLKTTNGQGSVGNWQTFIDSTIGDRYQNQLADEALYAKEQGIKRVQYQYALHNNGAVLDDQTALRGVVEQMFDESHKNSAKAKEDWESHKNDLEIAKKKFIENPDPRMTQDDVKNKIDEFNAQINATKPFIDKYGQQVLDTDKNSTEYQKNVQKWLDNPDGYFYDQVKTGTIQSIAKGLAANEKVGEPQVNQMFDQAYKMQQDAIKNNLDAGTLKVSQDRLALDAQKEKWDEEHPNQGRGRSNNGENNSNNSDTSSNIQGDLKYIGADNTNPVQVSSTERLNQQTNQAYYEGVAPFLDPDKMAKSLTTFGGLKYDYMVPFFTAVQDGKPYSQFTTEEKKVAQRIKEIMHNRAGVELNSFTPDDVAKAVHDYTAHYLKPEDMTEYNHDSFMELSSGYINSSAGFKKYMNLQTMKDKQLGNLISKDSKLRPFVKDVEGHKVLKTANDLAKELPDINMQDTGLIPISPAGVSLFSHGSYNSKLTANNFAKGLLDGSITIKKGSLTSVEYTSKDSKNGFFDHDNSGHPLPANGKRKLAYSLIITASNGGKTTIYPGDPQYAQIKAFNDHFGSGDDLQKRFKKISDEAASTVLANSPTGEIGSIYQVPVDSDAGVQLLKEATSSGNSDIIKVDGEPLDKTNNEQTPLTEFIRSFSNASADDLKKWFNDVSIKTNNQNGLPSVVLSLKRDLSEAEKKTLEDQFDLKDKDLNQLQSDKGIEIPIKADTKSPGLQNLFSFGNGVYINSQLNQGKVITSDPLAESIMGAKYKIVPNRSNAPTSAKIVGSLWQVDPKTGIGSWVDIPDNNISNFSLYQKSPDEIKNWIDGIVQANFERNVATLKSFKINNPDVAAKKDDLRTFAAEYDKKIYGNN